MYAGPLQPSQVGSLGLTRDDLIERTKALYTLYRSDYHVVAREKLVYLEHFLTCPQSSCFKWQDSQGSAGAKFSEEGRSDLHPLYQYLCQGPWPLTSIYPIPKETFTIPDVTYLETELIFEDVLAQLFQEYRVRSCLSFYLIRQPALERPSPCDHYRHFPPTRRDRQKKIATLGLSV